MTIDIFSALRQKHSGKQKALGAVLRVMWRFVSCKDSCQAKTTPFWRERGRTTTPKHTQKTTTTTKKHQRFCIEWFGHVRKDVSGFAFHVLVFVREDVFWAHDEHSRGCLYVVYLYTAFWTFVQSYWIVVLYTLCIYIRHFEPLLRVTGWLSSTLCINIRHFEPLLRDAGSLSASLTITLFQAGSSV